jgi:hypothetical protein
MQFCPNCLPQIMSTTPARFVYFRIHFAGEWVCFVLHLEHEGKGELKRRQDDVL